MRSDESNHRSPFEAIRQTDDHGNEYWRARDLANILQYDDYRNFQRVIEKAKVACEQSSQAVSDHFVDVTDMIVVGKGARRRRPDVHLSRYACYLIIQNADPEKPLVSLGQTYFAVQTRRQELADEEALAQLSEEQRRLLLRGQISLNNVQLAEAASQAGVITSTDFAIFQDHGYAGLYNGLRAKDIHARKGLKRGQKILDYMNSSELAANMFRITQTEDKIRREGITDKEQAHEAHRRMGLRVRQFIAEEGGIMPEDQPTPTRSIQQIQREMVQREAQKRLEQRKGNQQPSLFDTPEEDA
jgi:DNA-damage-inducible protein D